MIYDTGTIIVAAPTLQYAREALLQYGVQDVAGLGDDQTTIIPTIKIVTTYEGAVSTVSALPADTPWCDMGCTYMLFVYMRENFGAPVTMAVAVRALNNEYAINPKLLRG
jgi:hypothetical protein